jgi:uncharacterized protein YqjF (DUF2071 family)
MQATFRHCWLVSFRIPPSVLAAQLPSGIEPDIHGGWAWLSILIAAMEDMRPAFAPRIFAASFNQVVYRAAVRCNGEPGVYFLRTDADDLLYSWAGDLLTFFHFHHRPISISGRWRVAVHAEDAALDFALDHDAKEFESAAFHSLEAARPFLVERFHAFAPHPRSGRLGRVSVERGTWNLAPVRVVRWRADWMESNLPGAELDNALYAPDIAYLWSRRKPI